MLIWTTLSETNNDHFRILQKKNDAFVEVGTEPSQATGGTTNEATHYRHRVENVAPGRHVFRLAQVDTDSDEHVGAETTVEVSLNETYRLSTVYPNPAPGTARLTLTVRQPQSVRVEVFDVLGKPRCCASVCGPRLRRRTGQRNSAGSKRSRKRGLWRYLLPTVAVGVVRPAGFVVRMPLPPKSLPAEKNSTSMTGPRG